MDLDATLGFKNETFIEPIPEEEKENDEIETLEEGGDINLTRSLLSSNMTTSIKEPKSDYKSSTFLPPITESRDSFASKNTSDNQTQQSE